jgi:hypothetical protein
MGGQSKPISQLSHQRSSLSTRIWDAPEVFPEHLQAAPLGLVIALQDRAIPDRIRRDGSLDILS